MKLIRASLGTAALMATCWLCATAASIPETDANRAMTAASITIKGKTFPVIASDPGARTAGFCSPYDTRTQQRVAEVSAELAKGTPRNQSKMFSATYSPTLPVWVISTYQRVENNRIGPVASTVDAVPGGFHLMTTSQFQTEYNSVKNYVMNLNILDKWKADISVKLDEYVKNYSSYAMEISASHGTIVHKAILSGAGAFNGRTAYVGWIDTTEVCAPPEVMDAGALDKTLKAWVNGVVKTLPSRTGGVSAPGTGRVTN